MHEHGNHASSAGTFVVCPNHPGSPLRIIKFISMCIEIRCYTLSYGVPVRERYGSTLLPATREQHDQNSTQSH